MKKITRIGNVETFTTNSASRVTTGVTVPEGADIAIISSVYGTGGGSIVEPNLDEISLGGVEATTINQETDPSHGSVISCYVVNPQTGTTTLAIDAISTINLGPQWSVVYYSGVNTTDPIYSSVSHVFDEGGSLSDPIDRTYPIDCPNSGMTVGIWWTWDGSVPSVDVSGQTEVLNVNVEGSRPYHLISEEFESDELSLATGRYVSVVGFTMNPGEEDDISIGRYSPQARVLSIG